MEEQPDGEELFVQDAVEEAAQQVTGEVSEEPETAPIEVVTEEAAALIEVAKMSRDEKKELLIKWRQQIALGCVDPDNMNWWVYTVLAIDEIYHLLDEITQVMKKAQETK